MGRHKKIVPTKVWKISLQKDLADRIEAMLADPVTDKVLLGSRAAFIEARLREVLADIEAGRAAFDPITGRILRKRTP